MLLDDDRDARERRGRGELQTVTSMLIKTCSAATPAEAYLHSLSTSLAVNKQ